MVVGSRMKILDPVAEPVLEGASLAPRLDTLHGKVVGLYSNNKLNATRLLDMVEGLLGERYTLSGTVRGTYNSARVMRRDEWKSVEQCDAIILSNGD